MAHLLGALADFPEDPGSLSSTLGTIVAHCHYVTPVLGDSVPSSGLHGHFMHRVYMHAGKIHVK